MAGHVIIGAGLAGAKAAETLREEGYDGPVTLIGAEELRPYERPPLSKDYLLGKSEREAAFVHEPGWYAANAVDLRLGDPVVSIDLDGRTVRQAGGAVMPYERLLLATGSSARRLPVPGGERAMTLRTFGDSDRLRRAFAGAGRVVVAGAGWIGLETAAAAREAGCHVVVVEPEPGPLNRVLGPEVGAVFTALHRRHGVEFRFGTGVEEITATEVRTAEGERLPADHVVAGIGAAPNVDLAREAGLAVGEGVLVDASLRSTSHPDVFAAGDIAEAEHPLYDRPVRVEHWANALHGGPEAARSMLGRTVAYDRVPYFFTDQYELGMEFSGDVTGYDEVIFRGSVDDLEFVAFWLSGGRVVAGMNVNVWDVVDPIQDLIRRGGTPDPKSLADPGVPLESL
ncbi:FAD-dependent oxidoreductase [Spongiactinospora sp. TRM90649]|uniref:NAD(P)/FAD-dependent oxidoreductase n=1 Tax=Spongiactinospora sp. TRM90649 TaxID=3031114 RepID=UPI0023F6DC25|nr:FAD-dependent oxidoreductase [Spongiactinospora sp. TRM90649]MDF5757015.1 FAD-dependent oxidoreductase [Spongiactinospora sp. TRM90649]